MVFVLNWQMGALRQPWNLPVDHKLHMSSDGPVISRGWIQNQLCTFSRYYGTLILPQTSEMMTVQAIQYDLNLITLHSTDTFDTLLCVFRLKNKTKKTNLSPLLISIISSWARGQSPPMPPDPITPPRTFPNSLCGDAVAMARASGLQ